MGRRRSPMFEALTFGLGYNVALVTLGALALGLASGGVGGFLSLRGRVLVADAIAHATLPGLALGFLIMASLGGSGRFLPGLMLGSALSALVGLWVVEWLSRRTRLPEDAAIGAVLSVFFGAGVVLLTVIQTLPFGRQAGLEGFLLGSTAGMLRADAQLVALGGALVLILALVLRRPLVMAAFDPGFAGMIGVSRTWLDRALMFLVLAVVVVGMKIVGLILIVALLIIPAATARLWAGQAMTMIALSALFGGLSGYVGAAISASGPDLPTGAVIVLVAAALFAISLVAAPERGILAVSLRQMRLRRALRARLR